MSLFNGGSAFGQTGTGGGASSGLPSASAAAPASSLATPGASASPFGTFGAATNSTLNTSNSFGSGTLSAGNTTLNTSNVFGSSAPLAGKTAGSGVASVPVSSPFGAFGATASTAPSTSSALASTTSTPVTSSALASTTSTSAAKPLGGGTAPVLNALRNKTMDEVVNKWARDLDESTREFASQAEEVAEWDAVLVKNGREISRLYSALTQTESTQSQIDQSLDYVESQQADLDKILEAYEKQADQLLQGSGGDSVDLAMGAADAEREEAYALAESLHGQLADISRNLTFIVDEVNSLAGGATTARSAPHAGAGTEESPADVSGPGSTQEPISQMATILNAHLHSLRWIGENAAEMRHRVESLKKASRLPTS